MICPKCRCIFKFRLEIGVRGVALAPEIQEDIAQETPRTHRVALERYSDMELDAIDHRVAQIKRKRSNALEREILAGNKARASSPSAQYLRSARRTNRFSCPQCNTTLQFLCNVLLMDAVEWVPYEAKVCAADPEQARKLSYSTDGLTEAEIAVIEECRSKGILQTFNDVVQYEYTDTNQSPRRIERTFLAFLRDATQRKGIPKRIRDPFMRQFPDTEIDFWSANRVTAVTVNDEIIRFMPAKVIRRTNTPGIMATAAAADPDRTRNFESWIRTRNGYVPEGSRLFLAALRLQSRGVRPGYDGGADRMEY